MKHKKTVCVFCMKIVVDHKLKDPKTYFLNKDKCNKNAKRSVLLGGFFFLLFSDSDVYDTNKHLIFKEYRMVSQVVVK